MTRDEMVERMSSRELSAWMALFSVQADEANRRRDEFESGDGVVVISGGDEDDDEGDDGERTD